jgi:hypothetical protein
MEAETQENENLRRTVSRLRKRLQKLEAAVPVVEEESPAPKPVSPDAAKCAKCAGTEFKFFQTPKFLVRICVKCKDRVRVV